MILNQIFDLRYEEQRYSNPDFEFDFPTSSKLSDELQDNVINAIDHNWSLFEFSNYNPMIMKYFQILKLKTIDRDSLIGLSDSVLTFADEVYRRYIDSMKLGGLKENQLGGLSKDLRKIM
jgi:hypothetical protein